MTHALAMRAHNTRHNRDLSTMCGHSTLHNKDPSAMRGHSTLNSSEQNVMDAHNTLPNSDPIAMRVHHTLHNSEQNVMCARAMGCTSDLHRATSSLPEVPRVPRALRKDGGAGVDASLPSMLRRRRADADSTSRTRP